MAQSFEPSNIIEYQGNQHTGVFFDGFEHKEAWMEVAGELCCVWRLGEGRPNYYGVYIYYANGSYYMHRYDIEKAKRTNVRLSFSGQLLSGIMYPVCGVIGNRYVYVANEYGIGEVDCVSNTIRTYQFSNTTPPGGIQVNSIWSDLIAVGNGKFLCKVATSGSSSESTVYQLSLVRSTSSTGRISVTSLGVYNHPLFTRSGGLQDADIVKNLCFFTADYSNYAYALTQSQLHIISPQQTTSNSILYQDTTCLWPGGTGLTYTTRLHFGRRNYTIQVGSKFYTLVCIARGDFSISRSTSSLCAYTSHNYDFYLSEFETSTGWKVSGPKQLTMNVLPDGYTDGSNAGTTWDKSQYPPSGSDITTAVTREPYNILGLTTDNEYIYMWVVSNQSSSFPYYSIYRIDPKGTTITQYRNYGRRESSTATQVMSYEAPADSGNIRPGSSPVVSDYIQDLFDPYYKTEQYSRCIYSHNGNVVDKNGYVTSSTLLMPLIHASSTSGWNILLFTMYGTVDPLNYKNNLYFSS